MSDQNWLQRYRRSSSDAVIAGVCGGFGAVTSIPSWAWRVIFLCSVLFAGFGLLLYIFLWVCAPEPLAGGSGDTTPGDNWLQRFRRSSTDSWIAGICGGLGEVTPVPSWTWRVIFLCLVLYGGVGILLYLILWICTPKALNSV